MSEPKLTIGLACFDDFDGVYFTVTSLMVHHPEVLSDCEIVVVDNNPDSQYGDLVQRWMHTRVPVGKYFRFVGAEGTAQARNEVFRRASAPAVLCIDCHVLLAPGTLRRLIDYYATHGTCRDLLTGPLLTDSGRIAATHQNPEWRSGAWGTWSVDDRGRDPRNEPFEIWQQGMGLFSSRKDAWVGFHPDFRGFGGCESYVMEKVRQNGGRVLCCPWLRWTHRFARPNGAPYPVTRRDRLRNYLIGFNELGLDIEPVIDHFNVSRQQAMSLAASRRSKNEPDRIAVVGNRTYAGMRMRGEVLAEHLSCDVVTPQELPELTHRNTIFAVKNGLDPALLRARCDRLIYDPLDSFFSTRSQDNPVRYWRGLYHRFRFDDILATSPACYDTMREAFGDDVNVHLVPHQCDPRVREDWHDPDGPVVYAGLGRFLESGLERVRRACRMIGREFVVSRNVGVLRGASLALALRLPPYNTKLSRRCKPQIKLENAAAAGLPVVATECPASISLHPGIEVVPVEFTPSMLAGAMARALDQPGLSVPYTDHRYLGDMDRILGRPRRVVYTAIFGEDGELREPRVRTPGVQYICFTDNPNLKSKVWSIRYCKPSGDPLFQTMRFKILAHEAVDCDMSLWIDGRIELHELNGVFDFVMSDLALQKHPVRSCLYEEAEYCRQIRRGDPVRITETVNRYRAAGHPPNGGLWMGDVILRKHTPETESLNRELWREIQAGTSREQIVIPYVVRRMGISVDTLSHGAPRYQRPRQLI